jgi:hypothetical protein
MDPSPRRITDIIVLANRESEELSIYVFGRMPYTRERLKVVPLNTVTQQSLWNELLEILSPHFERP